MTNEVEKLIIEQKNKKPLKYDRSIAYLFYKEIWKFLLIMNKYEYKNAFISFQIHKKDNTYCIYKSEGIKFEIEINDFKSGWAVNYYENCEPYHIKNILNTSIDFRLLIRLLCVDGFNCDFFSEDNVYTVQISINKYTVNQIINQTLLKNKILKKEM